MGTLDEALASALAEGRCRIGQLHVTVRDGEFELRHRLDIGRLDLTEFKRPEDALAIGRFDEAGEFRPLKTAPNLRRGWALRLPNLTSLRLALEHFYPAALGTWLAWREGRLRAVSLRQTVLRQTGMYRVTRKITVGQADEVAELQCDSRGGCLRTIVWRIEDDGTPPASLPHEKYAVDFDQSGAGESVIPLLCPEACHLFVAAARERVKDASASSPPGSK